LAYAINKKTQITLGVVVLLLGGSISLTAYVVKNIESVRKVGVSPKSVYGGSRIEGPELVLYSEYQETMGKLIQSMSKQVQQLVTVNTKLVTKIEMMEAGQDEMRGDVRKLNQNFITHLERHE